MPRSVKTNKQKKLKTGDWNSVVWFESQFWALQSKIHQQLRDAIMSICSRLLQILSNYPFISYFAIFFFFIFNLIRLKEEDHNNRTWHPAIFNVGYECYLVRKTEPLFVSMVNSSYTVTNKNVNLNANTNGFSTLTAKGTQLLHKPFKRT